MGELAADTAARVSYLWESRATGTDSAAHMHGLRAYNGIVRTPLSATTKREVSTDERWGEIGRNIPDSRQKRRDRYRGYSQHDTREERYDERRFRRSPSGDVVTTAENC